MKIVLDLDSDDPTPTVAIMEAVAREIYRFARSSQEEVDDPKVGFGPGEREEQADEARRMKALARELRWAIRRGWTPL
jgi:hypothetical protein